MSRIAGVVSGVVSSVDDPASAGRVLVQFDWMVGAPQSYWARVAAPMAGGKRGAFFAPEISDEVLVSFDHGDVSHPYIVGYCWSNADQPPFGARQKQRGITTVLGHKLLFDDDASSSAITLATPAGYALTLDETNQKISVASAAGVSVSIDDTASSITLSLPTGSTFTLDPSGLTATILGEVNITAMAATITAPSVTIDAAVTSVTGVLNVAGPVIANGVVSPTYTPGVGNLV
jgi:phage baseplate assembly protein gpV